TRWPQMSPVTGSTMTWAFVAVLVVVNVEPSCARAGLGVDGETTRSLAVRRAMRQVPSVSPGSTSWPATQRQQAHGVGGPLAELDALDPSQHGEGVSHQRGDQRLARLAAVPGGGQVGR